MASFLASVQGAPWSAIATLKPELPNAVIAHLRYDGNGWQLVALDAAAHHAGLLAASDAAGS
jgi:hypothetical protein